MKVELLLHNLSHADLVLDTVPIVDGVSAPLVARPRFSEVNQISESLYKRVKVDLDKLPFDFSSPENRSGDQSLRLRHPKVATGIDISSLNLKYEVSKLRFRESLPELSDGGENFYGLVELPK